MFDGTSTKKCSETCSSCDNMNCLFHEKKYDEEKFIKFVKNMDELWKTMEEFYDKNKRNFNCTVKKRK